MAARSRISRFESEPLDPATSLQWESIEFPDSTGHSAAPQDYSYHDPSSFTPYQPHHQSAGGGFSGIRHDQPFSSPEISPPLRSQAWGRPGVPRVVSMVSPRSPDFPRTATSGPLGYSPLDASGGPRLSTLITEASPTLLTAGSNGFNAEGSPATYSIPPPPKPPTLPMDVDDDDMDYDRFKSNLHNAVDHEGPYSDRGAWSGGLGTNLGGNIGRDKSLARRISTRIMTTVRGRPKSGWDYRDKAGGVGAIDEESSPHGTKSGGYSRVGEVDEPIGVDLGFFTAEHVPAAAVQAMQDHKMDVDMVYTGECFYAFENNNSSNHFLLRYW